MGEFVKANQIISLEPYAAAYGWKDRFPTSVLGLASYSADGKTFGSGNLYGLPQMGEIVGVYYNKKKLQISGIKVPTTWSEFTAQLATIKKSGETPLVLGDLEKWPADPRLRADPGPHMPAAEIWTSAGEPGGDWTTDGNTDAATELAAGSRTATSPRTSTVKYDDSAARASPRAPGLFLIGRHVVHADLDPRDGHDVTFSPPPR